MNFTFQNARRKYFESLWHLLFFVQIKSHSSGQESHNFPIIYSKSQQTTAHRLAICFCQKSFSWDIITHVLLHIVYSSFHARAEERSHCDKDHMVHEVQFIIFPFKKCLVPQLLSEKGNSSLLYSHMNSKTLSTTVFPHTIQPRDNTIGEKKLIKVKFMCFSLTSVTSHEMKADMLFRFSLNLSQHFSYIDCFTQMMNPTFYFWNICFLVDLF